MFEKDFFSRMGSHLEYLVHKLEEANQGEESALTTIAGVSVVAERRTGKRRRFELSVKSRMAANLVYETISTAKREIRKEEEAHTMRMGSQAGQTETMPFGDVQESELHIASGNGLEFPAFYPVYDNGFGQSGVLDILADWHSLIDIG